MFSFKPKASWMMTTPGNGPSPSGQARKPLSRCFSPLNETVCVVVGTRFLSGALGRVAGVHPVLFAALVLVCVFVTHGHQLTDDPRRGVSVGVRAVGHDLGRLVWHEDRAPVLEPDRTW